MSTTPPTLPPQPARRWGWRLFFWFCFLASIAANVVLVLIILVLEQISGFDDSAEVYEKYYSGNPRAATKIAILHINGILLEGLTGFAEREIHHAANDPHVTAVVVRINSPGGTISASDDLHHRLELLTKGDPSKGLPAKPMVVSMGSLAASGGYYIAMPGQILFAEPTCLTGSIGVFAALPNFTGLARDIGFHMEVIKAGEVKDSGSMFHEMTEKERALWQNMVDRYYLRFLEVVEHGRPALKGKLQEDLVYDEVLPIRDTKSRDRKVKYTRYRADGGIYTAAEARSFGLIDRIGHLEDAIEAAKKAAGLSDVRVVSYERPVSVVATLFGVQSTSKESTVTTLTPERLSSSVTPRLWYLSPQADLAGLIAGAGSVSTR